MRAALLKILMALPATLSCLSACRTPTQGPAVRSGSLHSDPSVAAKSLFQSHYDFYHEDPTLFKELFAPRLFRALKRQHDDFESTRLIGTLDRDPWTNAQDGKISHPYCFTTLKTNGSEAVVRFQYLFDLGPDSRIAQSVLMKFKRSPSGATWQFSDLIMPDNVSLVGLLEGNP
jgi:hypothetical protein